MTSYVEQIKKEKWYEVNDHDSAQEKKEEVNV